MFPIIYALTLHIWPFTSLHVGHCVSSLSIALNFMFLTAEEINGGMAMVLTNSQRTWLVLCMLHNVLELCAVNKDSQCVLGKALF